MSHRKTIEQGLDDGGNLISIAGPVVCEYQGVHNHPMPFEQKTSTGAEIHLIDLEKTKHRGCELYVN